jgi:hypothetical protein
MLAIVVAATDQKQDPSQKDMLTDHPQFCCCYSLPQMIGSSAVMASFAS